jgi:hypothetical protein
MKDTMIMPVARDSKKINQALKRLRALGLSDAHQLLYRARKGADSSVFYDLALVGNLTENLLAGIGQNHVELCAARQKAGTCTKRAFAQACSVV